jgi:hypothetical protein
MSDSGARFWDAAQNLLQAGIQAGGTLYRADAQRKLYDFQSFTEDRVSSFISSLATDPDYGELTVEDSESYIRNKLTPAEKAALGFDPIKEKEAFLNSQLTEEEKKAIEEAKKRRGEDSQLLWIDDNPAVRRHQELTGQWPEREAQGSQARKAAEEKAAALGAEWKEKIGVDGDETGYTGKWNRVATQLQAEVDKIQNPLAREEAQRYLDARNRDIKAEVYDKKVAMWKKETLAKELTDMDKMAKSTMPPEQVMEYASQRLDWMQSYNIIQPSQREEILSNYANVAMSHNLSTAAKATLEAQGIHQARRQVINAQGSLPFQGKEYYMSDQAKAKARNDIEEAWNQTQDLEDERLDKAWAATFNASLNASAEGTGFDPRVIRGGLTADMIEKANLSEDRKQAWRSRLHGSVKTMRAEGAGSGTSSATSLDLNKFAEEQALLIQRGELTQNQAMQNWQQVYNNGMVNAEEERKVLEVLNKAIKSRMPNYGHEIDTTTNYLKGLLSTYKNKPQEAALQEAVGYMTYALHDLLNSTTTTDMSGAEFKDRLRQIQDTTIGYTLDSLSGKHEIKGLTQDAKNQRAITNLNDLEKRREGVYFNDRTGAVEWDTATKKTYNETEGFFRQEILEKSIREGGYGLPPGLIAQPQQDGDDIKPVPIWTDQEGKYSYILRQSATGRLEVIEIDRATKRQYVLPLDLAERAKARGQWKDAPTTSQQNLPDSPAPRDTQQIRTERN